MNETVHRESRFKNILFCTDFSESSDLAFELAIDATIRRPGCKLVILHVVPEVDAQFWRAYLYELENVDSEARKTIDDKIAAAYLARVPEGMDVKVEVRGGSEAAEILDFAEKEQSDLIVIGRHGHSGIHKAFFGSVAEKIVRKARCAVLVVPLA
jgi:nucleotide-binding universal stress UspA family protein